MKRMGYDSDLRFVPVVLHRRLRDLRAFVVNSNRKNGIFDAMFGWFGKWIAGFRTSETLQNEIRHPDRTTTELKDHDRALERKMESAKPEAERVGIGILTNSPAKAEDLTSVPIMVEILKLLARIEYGLDVEQIAISLAISPEDALANCDALDREALIHHHEGLAEWFIGQRGLEFLRLNGDLESKT